MMAEKRKRDVTARVESPREERLRRRTDAGRNIPAQPRPLPRPPTSTLSSEILPQVPANPPQSTLLPRPMVTEDTPMNTAEKPKYQLKTPIVEQTGAFPIMHHLNEVQIPISAAQLLANAPTLRKEVLQALSPKRQEVKTSFTVTNGDTTSLSAPVLVEGVPARALIDTGAAVSVISNSFRRKLEFDISKPASYKIKGIDGKKIVPLGEIEGLPLSFGKVTVPITVAVIDAPGYEIILGND